MSSRAAQNCSEGHKWSLGCTLETPELNHEIYISMHCQYTITNYVHPLLFFLSSCYSCAFVWCQTTYTSITLNQQKKQCGRWNLMKENVIRQRIEHEAHALGCCSKLWNEFASLSSLVLDTAVGYVPFSISLFLPLNFPKTFLAAAQCEQSTFSTITIYDLPTPVTAVRKQHFLRNICSWLIFLLLGGIYHQN